MLFKKEEGASDERLGRAVRRGPRAQAGRQARHRAGRRPAGEAAPAPIRARGRRRAGSGGRGACRRHLRRHELHGEAPGRGGCRRKPAIVRPGERAGAPVGCLPLRQHLEMGVPLRREQGRFRLRFDAYAEELGLGDGRPCATRASRRTPACTRHGCRCRWASASSR